MIRPLVIAAILALTACADRAAPLPFSHCMNLQTGQDMKVTNYIREGMWTRIIVRDRNSLPQTIDRSNSDQWECFP